MNASSTDRSDSSSSALGFSAPFVRVVVDYLQAQEMDTSAVLSALGLSEAQLSDAAQRVPSLRLTRALHLAQSLCGDPQTSLNIAALVRPAHLGSLGYALLSAPEGGAGLTLFERMQTLVCNEMLCHHTVSGPVVESRHELLGPVPRDPAFWTFFVAARHGFARWVSGRELVPLRIDLPCPPPADPEPFLRFIGAPVRFNTPDCRELIPTEWLSWGNPNADPAVHGLMASIAGQQHQAAADNTDEILALLKQRIVLSLHEGSVPTLDSAVAQLFGQAHTAGASSRQLQRRLAERGLSFKSLVEDVRREQALSHLEQTDLPLADVAQRLGYAEPSSFHRAVRRWTGLTPLAVRERAKKLSTAKPPKPKAV